MMVNWLLLAKRDLQGAPPVSWHRLQEQWVFTAKGLMPVAPILVTVAILTVVLVLVGCWRSGQFRRLRPTSLRIFNQVIQGLGLARSEISLLVCIARQQQLPSPLTLVLSAATLDHHVRAYAQSIAADSRRRGQVENQIRHIKQVLFDIVEANPPEIDP